MSTEAKDLTKESPAAPSSRVGGYVILARLADKARAEFLGGKISDYHTNCPLDNMLLDWKGVPYDDVKKQIMDGADDGALAKFLDANGSQKSPEEIKEWSDSLTKASMYNNPERKEWFAGECDRLGLDPTNTTTFQWLEADDRDSHPA